MPILNDMITAHCNWIANIILHCSSSNNNNDDDNNNNRKDKIIIICKCGSNDDDDDDGRDDKYIFVRAFFVHCIRCIFSGASQRKCKNKREWTMLIMCCSLNWNQCYLSKISSCKREYESYENDGVVLTAAAIAVAAVAVSKRSDNSSPHIEYHIDDIV